VEKPSEVYVNGEKLEGALESGLPALVRGMFVQCQIHTVTPKNVVLIPKLALKPGNQLWKFEQEDSLIAPEESPKTDDAEQTKDEGATKKEKNAPVSIDPKDWRAGKVIVTNGINVANLIKRGTDNAEFWVVEGGDMLKPNDLVIVSPLANIVGDGTDAVRYQVTNSSDSPQSDVSSESNDKTSPVKKD
jgi:hypothetical protein